MPSGTGKNAVDHMDISFLNMPGYKNRIFTYHLQQPTYGLIGGMLHAKGYLCWLIDDGCRILFERPLSRQLILELCIFVKAPDERFECIPSTSVTNLIFYNQPKPFAKWRISPSQA